MIPVSRPSIGKEELSQLEKVFASGWLGMGSVTKEFEDAVAAFLGADYENYVVAVNTGTTALHLALDALGIKAQDEVILPSLTFVAAAQAVIATGATPVFCDVEEETLNINVRDLERKITPKTKAIMPVHYRGLPCNMDEILRIANNNLRVIEDAAHAFGSYYKDKRIGSFGDITCFSFDPIKNITCGEGGAVVTRDKALCETLQRKRILGIDKDTWSRYRNERSWFYDVCEPGYRYHMSNINAAIGLEQLKKFEKLNKRKIEIAKSYDSSFRKLNKIKLLKTDYNGLALFTYILKVESGREELMSVLKDRGIDSGIHYIPIHKFKYFLKFAKAPLPVTEKLYSRILTLPLFPDMSDSDVEEVITAVTEWCKR